MRRRGGGSAPVEDGEPVLQELATVVEMLGHSWLTVHTLQVSMVEYRRLYEAIDNRYGANGLGLIYEWFRVYLLVRCRVVVDETKEARSVRQALRRLRGIADRVTAQEIVEVQRRTGRVADVEEIHRILESELGVTPDEPIGVRRVQAELQRIGKLGDIVRNYATSTAAHDFGREDVPVPTYTQITQLLDELTAIYRRWSLVLSSTDVFADAERFNMTADRRRAASA